MCREKVYTTLVEYSQYSQEVEQAEEAVRRSVKGYKAPQKPYPVKKPTINSAYLLFLFNLMTVKNLLFKYGYKEYWSKWSLIESCDTALLLLIKGCTVG